MNSLAKNALRVSLLAAAVSATFVGCGSDSDDTTGTTAPEGRSTDIANPYHYGFIPEVTVTEAGETSVVKHYSMGRGTWEMTKVMPDQKTAYFGDDGTHGLMSMYIADNPADLSAGTLYAAKWNQTSADGADGGAADLEWIKLGHATDAEVRALIDEGLEFNDIFEAIEPNSAAPFCADGYTHVRSGSTADECLMVKPGMEKAAAFLETRRYAAIKGATTEFTKMEGIAVNDADKKLYMAISAIRDSMTSMEGEPADDIRLTKNSAGATYTGDLNGATAVSDSEGHAIASQYVATNLYVEPALLGVPLADADTNGNTADVDSVANTDNIYFSEKMRTLFIGEDSGMHINNFVWAYNVDTQNLTRILTSVAGAENTGLQVVEDLNGFAYIMSNNQHWGDFSGSMNEGLQAVLEPMIDKFDAPVGYIGGMPAVGDNVASVTFSDTPAPTATEDFARTYTDSQMTITYTDGTPAATYDLEYVRLFGVKDKVGSNPYAAGQLYNHEMQPLADPFGQPVIAETPDANSLMQVGNSIFLVNHFEYDWLLSDGSEGYKVDGWYGRMPMSMALTQLYQNPTTGELTAIEQHPIDFSDVDGLWIPCFGSLSPWNTHLGSEEDYDLIFNPLTSKYSKTEAGLQALNEVYFSDDHVLK